MVVLAGKNIGCNNEVAILHCNEVSECVYPSANRFPTTFENEIRISIFVFCFPAISKNGIQTSIFFFRFP